MKVGYIILCRYNSKRLPGKILRKIHGKPILKYIVERLECVAERENIVVATSIEDTDNPIVEYCDDNGINVFRGSLENVAKRFLDCALHYGFDYATRTNGDNIFGVISAMVDMHEIAKKGSYDLVSNVKGRTFPKGMSIEVVKTSYYQQQFELFSEPSHFEHVTSFLYKNDEDKNHYYYYNKVEPEAAGIQLAIDDIEDFSRAEEIISKFELPHTSYDLSEVYSIYRNIR